MNRRELLRSLPWLGALGPRAIHPAVTGAKPAVAPAVISPRVNGGINVQPVRRFDPGAGFSPPLIVPEIVDAQMRAVYELGFEQMRISISYERFGPNFVGAIPYVRAARALGIDVLGIVTQFSGFDLLQAIRDREIRDETLETYIGVFAEPVAKASAAVDRIGDFDLQILNEPTHFLGISPSDYVRGFLLPAYLHLKEDSPLTKLIAAAPVGTVDGVRRVRAMIEAGLEFHCDRVAYHLYSERIASELSGLASKPVWITETGVRGVARHLSWFRETLPSFREQIGGVERAFWFDLYDATPDEFRLIDLVQGLDGMVDAVPESVATVDYLNHRVLEALGESSAIPYESLVPDIRVYFPTDEDFRILRATRVGAETWGG